MELIDGHPGWYGWRSSEGTWWATRRGEPLSEGHYDAGLRTTIAADTRAELLSELAEQDRIATPA